MRLRYKHWNHSIWQPEYKRRLRLHYRCTTLQIPNKDLKIFKIKTLESKPVRNLQRCTAPQNSCTAKLQLFSSILEAKQQLNSSCSGMQKRCAAFEALGSGFAAQLPTFKSCEVAAVTLQFSCARSDSTTFLSAHNMNRQKSLLPQITAFITRKLWLYL